MLLAREQEIADRIAFAPQRLNHTFCLVRRHDGVLLPLEEDHRLREPIRVIDRRALAIARFLLRIRSDQPVEIARLELVGVARERPWLPAMGQSGSTSQSKSMPKHRAASSMRDATWRARSRHPRAPGSPTGGRVGAGWPPKAVPCTTRPAPLS